jgi:hypothetical protein
MSDFLGVDNVMWLARGVFWVAIVFFGVTNFIQIPGYAQVIVLAMAYMIMSMNQDQPSLFMEACMNHSTEAACVNFGQCELVQETFDIDEEWAVYRRNKCITGMPVDKTRLYNSYDPDRCTAWGDCSQTCKNRLLLIRAEIDGYECPTGAKTEDLFSSVDDFPLANSSVMKLFPFNYEGPMKFWGLLAVGLCTILILTRLAAKLGTKPTK